LHKASSSQRPMLCHVASPAGTRLRQATNAQVSREYRITIVKVQIKKMDVTVTFSRYPP
jgi:hypothetical protein